MIELDGLMGTSTPASAGTVIEKGASADFAAALSAMQLGDESPSSDESPSTDQQAASPKADTATLVSGLAAVFLAAPVAPVDEAPVVEAPMGPAVPSLEAMPNLVSGEEIDPAPVVDLALAATPPTAPDAGPLDASSVTPVATAALSATPGGEEPIDEVSIPEQLEIAVGPTPSDGADDASPAPSVSVAPASRTTEASAALPAAGVTPPGSLRSDAAVPVAPAEAMAIPAVAAPAAPPASVSATSLDPTNGAMPSSNDSRIDATPAGTEAVDSAPGLAVASKAAAPAEAAPAAEPSPFAATETETRTIETAEAPATSAPSTESGAPVATETPLRSSDAGRAADITLSAATAGPAPRAAETPTPTAPPSTMPDAPADATPAQQVAEALRDVRRLADGSHRLSLRLHPEELGAVQLEVAIREGQLHVRAVAETEAARVAIERSLPELRAELRDAGVRAGSLEVGPDTSGRDSAATGERDAAPSGRSQETTPANEHIDSPTPSTAGAVDIRL